MSVWKRTLAVFLLGFACGVPLGIYGYIALTPLINKWIVRADFFFDPLVVEVTDGDTLRVRSIFGNERKVRLIGVNTPETKAPGRDVECYGLEASAETKKLAEGRSVGLTFDPVDMFDKYNRVLVYATLKDGSLLNRILIERGYAYENGYGSRYERQKEFRDLQKAARDKALGLWLTCPLRKGS